MMKIISSVILFFVSVACLAQNEKTEKSKYDPHPLFSPLFYPATVNEYRASTGELGPKYWQNKASYQVNASLDNVYDALTASVTVSYTNNSPHALELLWQ